MQILVIFYVSVWNVVIDFFWYICVVIDWYYLLISLAQLVRDIVFYMQKSGFEFRKLHLSTRLPDKKKFRSNIVSSRYIVQIN
jgi:hypothetical protein